MRRRADLLERKSPSGVYRVCSICRKDMRADEAGLWERFKQHKIEEHPSLSTSRQRQAGQRLPLEHKITNGSGEHVATICLYGEMLFWQLRILDQPDIRLFFASESEAWGYWNEIQRG